MKDSLSDIDYSLVICSFNPDERILNRCLQAVQKLNREGLKTELILADNNSPVILEEEHYIHSYLSLIENMQIIRVAEPGVKFARMASIRIARGRYIIYIDSDNEPEADYLQQLRKLNFKFPEVAAWGPGNVTVDFIDGINSAIESYARKAFQEKKFNTIQIGGQTEWQDFYPVGTGLCTNTSVLKNYVAEADQGRYSQPGRKGDLLTSGEDTQMILLTIRSGFSVGSAPELKLTHIIPASRANQNYLRRLAFGTAVCYDTCMLEVFPEKLNAIRNKWLAPAVFNRRVFRKWLGTGFGSIIVKTFELTEYIGLKSGTYDALGKPLPAFVQWMIKILKAA